MAQGCAWRRMNSADAAIGLCAEGFRGPVQFLKIAGFANPPCGKVRAVTLRTPYLLFIGDAPDQLAAKTAAGIAFWRPEICLGQLRLLGCNFAQGYLFSRPVDIDAATALVAAEHLAPVRAAG